MIYQPSTRAMIPAGLEPKSTFAARVELEEDFRDTHRKITQMRVDAMIDRDPEMVFQVDMGLIEIRNWYQEEHFYIKEGGYIYLQ